MEREKAIEAVINVGMDNQRVLCYPTMQFRWKKDKYKQTYELQQKFINKDNGEEIWQYLPKVGFKEED